MLYCYMLYWFLVRNNSNLQWLLFLFGLVTDVCETRKKSCGSCKLQIHFPKSSWPLFICLHRLVSGLPAGLGSFPQAGHPQHADELPGMVALRDCSLPGRHHQRAGVGGAVCRLSTGCCRVHGDCFSVALWVFFSRSKSNVWWVVFLFFLTAVSTLVFQWILFVPTAVSNWFLCGCQCSSWKCPGRRVHGAGQAVRQSLPHHCMYESMIWPENMCSCPPVNGCTWATDLIPTSFHWQDFSCITSVFLWCFHVAKQHCLNNQPCVFF